MLSLSFGRKLFGLSPTMGIFYVAQTVERLVEIAFGKKCVGSSLTIGIFLYVTQVVQCVLGVALKS